MLVVNLGGDHRGSGRRVGEWDKEGLGLENLCSEYQHCPSKGEEARVFMYQVSVTLL